MHVHVLISLIFGGAKVVYLKEIAVKRVRKNIALAKLKQQVYALL